MLLKLIHLRLTYFVLCVPRWHLGYVCMVISDISADGCSADYFCAFDSWVLEVSTDSAMTMLLANPFHSGIVFTKKEFL